MQENKRILIKLVFDQAKKEISQTSISSVAAYLSLLFEDQYGTSKNERTFVRYYKSIVEDNTDYKIDAVTLDQLSIYTGYKDFSDFLENYRRAPIYHDYGSVKITITENETKQEPDSTAKLVVNINNAPVFSMPEFITQHKNSLGIVGLLIMGGLWLNQSSDLFKVKTDQQPALSLISKTDVENVNTNSTDPSITAIMTNPIIEKEQTLIPNNTSTVDRKKECMFWNEDHFEASYCDDIKNNANAKPLDEERLKVLRKINRIDTLTLQNSLGKVWYDKSNRKIEFFTHHGLHPTNGKTLKPVSEHILRKYAINN